MLRLCVLAAIAACLLPVQGILAAEIEASTTAASPAATPTDEAKPPAVTKPRIEIALLLDTSSSMSGLINQARTHLWKIVNEFEAARRDGERADVDVALYEYGNSRLDGKTGYIRQVVPLTIDLDKISEELFALTTNGGSEHCGQVIDRAVSELAWSDAQADLRCIFIAGNEPFTQGPVPYQDACHAAANKNITVSTIHCGGYDAGISGNWADGAKLADGSYLNIDQNQAEPHIAAPQDEALAELNRQLNATYCAYGSADSREEAAERQVAQDSNAEKLAPAALASRIQTKSSRLYRNASWDLVDAVKESKVDLAKIEKDQLPEELQGLSAAELKAHVDKLAAKRKLLQEAVKKLGAERAQYVAAERAKLAESGTNTLDEAIIATVRDQATRQAFEFAAE